MSAPMNGPERSTTTETTTTIVAVSTIFSASPYQNRSSGRMTVNFECIGQKGLHRAAAQAVGNASFRPHYRFDQLEPVAERVGNIAAFITLQRFVLVRPETMPFEPRAQARQIAHQKRRMRLSRRA